MIIARKTTTLISVKSNSVNHLHNKEALEGVLWAIKSKEVIGIKHRTEGIHANTKRTSQKKNDDALAKLRPRIVVLNNAV